MARFNVAGLVYLDNSGDQLTAGTLSFYESGGSTQKDTYSDEAETTANPWPVVISAAARAPNIFFTGTAKIIIRDSDGVQIEELDPVSAGTSTEFATMAELAAASLSSGLIVTTASYRTSGDEGGAQRVIKTAAEASADGDIIDGYGNITLANGNVAILLVSGAINVRQYGVIGSHADNRLAFLAAGAANKQLYAPGNDTEYDFDGSLAFTEPKHIFGDGIGKTKLNFTASGNISFTYTDYTEVAIVERLTMSCDVRTSLDAILINMSGTTDTDTTGARLIVDQVHIDAGAGGWEGKLINLFAAINCRVNDCRLIGILVDGNTTVETECGVYAGGADRSFITNNYFHKVQDAVLNNASENLKIENNTGDYLQGGIATDGVSYGSGQAIGNDFTCHGTGIEAVDGWTISNNTLDIDSVNSTGTIRQIIIEGDSYVHGNLFKDTSGAGADITGIYCNQSVGIDFPVVGHNTYNNLRYGVFVDSAAQNITIADGAFINVTDPLSIHADATDVTFPGKRTLVTKSVSQILSNNVNDPRDMDTVTEGKSWFFDIAQPTRLTADVSGWYMVSGQVEFTTNTTGGRQASIHKNGAYVTGYPFQVTANNSTYTANIALGEKKVHLDAGDYIELVVKQNSGSSMTMPAGETFLSMEWVSSTAEAI